MTADQEKLFFIPDVINPAGRICVRIYWPEDSQHLAILHGLLDTLTRWNYWDRDAAHSGAALAAIYKDVIATLSIGCELFDVRQNPTNPCILEKSTDGGVTWAQFADMSLCVNQQIPPGNPGYTQPGLQPGHGITQPGHCSTTNIAVGGGRSLIIPFVIAVGYTVEIDNPSGLFVDYAALPVLGEWFCYDGGVFQINDCSGSQSGAPTDPAPSLNHMALILAAPDGTYHALTAGTPYTVPSGMPSGQWYLLSNNPGGGNFGGSVQMTLKICNTNSTGALTITPAPDPFACATQGTVSNTNPNIGDTVTFTATQSPDGFWAVCQSFNHQSSWQLLSVNIPAGSGDSANGSLFVWHGSNPTNGGHSVGDVLQGQGQTAYTNNAWTFTARLISIP